MWNNEKDATLNGKAFYHSGPHPDYSLKVAFEVRDIKMRYRVHGNVAIALQEISTLQQRLRIELDANSVNTAKRLH